MIPLYLEFQAFGPYPRKECIDFTCFGDQHLFLIRGETGAGKTVILDAITYALYGRSSGAGRGDLVSMRCQQAEDKDVTYTSFVFSVDRREYKFERSLYRRKKRNGTIEFDPRQDAFVRSIDGEWIPIFENPRKSDVDTEAVRVIGLQYDQFRQVVILPQGQFERLLVANSEDKEAILSSLFGTSLWGDAAELLGERAREKQRLAEQQGALCRSLLELNSCENQDDLLGLLEQIKTECQSNALILGSLRESQKLMQSEISAASALEQEFLRLDRARAALAELNAEYPQIDEKKRILKGKEFAEIYHEWSKAQKEAIERQKSVRDHNIMVGERERSIKSYEETLVFQDERIEFFQKQSSHEAEYAEQCARYKQLEEKENEIIRTMGMIERLGYEADQLAKEHATSQATYEKASRNYWKQTEATLATRLTKGKACPVCGSKEHPQPAKAPRGEAVTAPVLDEFFKQTDALYRSMTEKYSEMQLLREAVRKQQQELFESGKYSAEDVYRAKDELAAARKAKSQLLLMIDKRAETNELLAKLRSERDELFAKREQIILLNERCQEQEKIWRERVLALDPDAMLKEQSQDTYRSEEEYRQIELDIGNFEKKLAENTALVQALSKSLADKERPPIAAIQAKFDAAASALKKVESEDVLLRKKCDELEQLNARYVKEYEKYSLYSREAEKSVRFSRLLRGSNGIGLQRYVLGAMLSVVTDEANRLLRNVHGGRYQIYRTDTAAGLVRKSGLELEVLDRWSGERRSVTSLSGGEKFLVALSLSIGLSGAVQARSATNKLGAVFIDEGFGTLDRNSMQDALQILSSIGISNGLVGIISHVQALQETIPAGILVKKDARGSTLRVICD